MLSHQLHSQAALSHGVVLRYPSVYRLQGERSELEAEDKTVTTLSELWGLVLQCGVITLKVRELVMRSDTNGTCVRPTLRKLMLERH